MDAGTVMLLVVVVVMLVFIGLAVNKTLKRNRAGAASNEPQDPTA